MTNLIIQVSKYLIIVLMALYTFQCYTVFQKKDEEAREYLFLRQNMLMFFMHFVAFTVLYLEMAQTTVLMFYGAQVIYLAAVLILFRNLYPLASKLLINNMCMLICVGFIMITRLSYDQSIKQFKIAVFATVVALLIPFLIRKLRFITKMYWLYALVGIGLLALVAILARSTNGAKLSFSFGGISIQPSEFVKIIYVFAIAGLLSRARDFRRIVTATALAALHVLILVASKDLGSAVIFFITYLIMLFVATRNPFYVLAGILSGSVAAVGAYFLFAHIRVRVQAWQDPFRDYQGGGYQICQSLFSISAGGWFGTGLYQGSPRAIPYVEQDFMFSAIAEELGSIFGICLILVCMSCFIMFINIAMQLTNRYYRLVAVGLGTTYAAQIFLTVGGGIKLIPMTGVTLPLVSYGGSSMLSTLIMFAIVQGLYMLRRDEELRAQKQEMAAGDDMNRYGFGGYGQGPYDQNGYGPGNYGQGSYVQNGYGPGNYGQGPYDQNSYGPGNYGQGPYDQDGYGSGNYGQGPYDQNGYGSGDYSQGSYDRDGFEPESYSQGSYDRDGYEPEGYSQGSYNQNWYGPGNYGQDPYGQNNYEAVEYGQRPYDRNDSGYGDYDHGRYDYYADDEDEGGQYGEEKDW